MRARGANVTDIVVLVVAANDGVMPQTLEALNHAKAAKVPILVAVNKMDHPNANPMKVRQQLQDKGLVPDDWGGDTIFVDVSALTKQGVDKLLEMILLQAELLELKANPDRRAKGNIIESGVEPGGPTATVLVRKGTLRVGDIILCGEFYGRVRALISEEGKRLKEAGPSVAVKVLGLNGVRRRRSGPCRRHPPRRGRQRPCRHRHGQTRGRGAQLLERHRHSPRRQRWGRGRPCARARCRRDQLARVPHRHQPPPRGSLRRARPLGRVLRRLLGAVGPALGVPGALEGSPRGGRLDDREAVRAGGIATPVVAAVRSR